MYIYEVAKLTAGFLFIIAAIVVGMRLFSHIKKVLFQRPHESKAIQDDAADTHHGTDRDGSGPV